MAVRDRRDAVLIVGVMLIVVGLAAGAMVASRAYRPIRRLLRTSGSTTKDNNQDVLDEMRLISERIKELSSQQRLLRARLEQSRTIIREQGFYGLLNGELPPAEVRAQLDALFSQVPEVVVVAVIELLASDTTRMAIDHTGALVIAARELVSEWSADGEGVYHELYEDRVVVILAFDRAIEPSELRSGMLRAFRSARTGSAVVAGVGTAKCAESIHASFAEADRALSFIIQAGSQSISFYAPEMDEQRNNFVEPMDDSETELLAALKAGDLTACESAVDRMVSIIRDHTMSDRMVRVQLAELIGRVRQHLDVYGADIGSVFSDLRVPEQLTGRIDAAELRRVLVLFFSEVIEHRRVHSKRKHSHAITQMRQYVEEHYHEDIGVEDIAAHLGWSASHFARIMRDEMGVTFISYLKKHRIERAVERLRTTNSYIKEVGHKVGFRSQNYFIKVFKEQVGMTPESYRQYFLSQTGIQ